MASKKAAVATEVCLARVRSAFVASGFKVGIPGGDGPDRPGGVKSEGRAIKKSARRSGGVRRAGEMESELRRRKQESLELRQANMWVSENTARRRWARKMEEFVEKGPAILDGQLVTVGVWKVMGSFGFGGGAE